MRLARTYPEWLWTGTIHTALTLTLSQRERGLLSSVKLVNIFHFESDGIDHHFAGIAIFHS
jgi:hypothetical protein